MCPPCGGMLQGVAAAAMNGLASSAVAFMSRQWRIHEQAMVQDMLLLQTYLSIHLQQQAREALMLA